ncbi:MAG TPA: lipid-binding SYLF domain-containing protein [Steroidobacteraceae bacterium]|nr:lipid-binding SYLF domain-containing protein [Steroidobacteraceae bacterium]
MKKLLLTIFLVTAGASAAPAFASAREEARLIEASGVLEELGAQRDTAIPDRLMQRAYGIAVIPNVVKVGAVVGGRRGSGAMVVRDENGRFSDPIMISITGGSVGWQLGVQSTDLVLVFTTKRGIEGIADGKLTLGGDASVAAGPVGRSASAGTDQDFKAEVYSYSRNKGLFAGLSIDGSVIAIDSRSNNRLYGQSASASDIIARRVNTNVDAAKRFERAVAQSTATSYAPSAATSSATASPVSSEPAAAPQAGATAFPLEDSAPGSEPPK